MQNKKKQNKRSNAKENQFQLDKYYCKLKTL